MVIIENQCYIPLKREDRNFGYKNSIGLIMFWWMSQSNKQATETTTIYQNVRRHKKNDRCLYFRLIKRLFDSYIYEYSPVVFLELPTLL